MLMLQKLCLWFDRLFSLKLRVLRQNWIQNSRRFQMVLTLSAILALIKKRFMMNRSMQNYRLQGASWVLGISANVLDYLAGFRQVTFHDKEKIGQLYSNFLGDSRIEINKATLVSSSGSSRYSVILNQRSAKIERRRLFKKSLYCIGVWHSHPEPIPHPSFKDLEFAKDHAEAAREYFNGIVFIILGQSQSYDGIYVGIHDGSQMHQLCKESIC